MKDADAEAFARVMAVLNETFGNPDRPVTDVKLEFYFRAFADTTIQEFEQAALTLANTKTIHTFPTPAEIREAIHGKPEDRAERAFSQLIEGLSKGGFHSSIEFQNGAIVKVIEALGGWDQVCEWKTADREWHRKEFVKLYRVYSTSSNEQPVRVIGDIEHRNRLAGFEEDREPKRIGFSVAGLPSNVVPLIHRTSDSAFRDTQGRRYVRVPRGLEETGDGD